MNSEDFKNLTACMNTTKWDELRLMMYAQKPAYKWKSKCVGHEFIYGPDSEWYYHFRDGGYADLEWVDILTESQERHAKLISLLVPLGLPGEVLETSVRIFGYQKPGQTIEIVKKA